MQSTRHVAILLGFLWNITLTSAFIAFISPSKIRLGTNQKLFLLGLGLADNDREYSITMAPSNGLSHTFYRQTHTIQNGVLTPIHINVTPSDIVLENDEYVTLRVRSTREGGFERSKTIKLDKSPGYLFVQTDKPIYTSRQSVKYRVIAVDEDLKWAPWSVQISLLNPRGHLIERITKSARDAFTGDEFPLSRNPMKGDWKIRASYNNFSTESITVFEVREYVLPRFGVKVKSNSTSVYVQNSSPIKLSVTAEYVYGRPVHGRLTITLFARLFSEDHVIFHRLPYQLDSSGKVDIIFDDEEIKDHDVMMEIVTAVEVYAAINVTEDGTDNVLRKEFKVATFADYPYSVTVINRRRFYQAGLPYALELEARNPDGSVAKDVPVDIDVEGQESVTLRTNDKGRISKDYPTPENGGALQFTYRPLGLPDEQISFSVHPTASEENHHIKVSAQQTPPMDRDLPVTVSFVSSPGLYYMMVTARGQVIFLESHTSGTNGNDVKTIPRHVLKDMVPKARILVFYVANERVVADSMVLEMRSVCREELSMSKVGDQISYKPKETGQLRIRGGPNMTVGLVAVDKGVYSLKYEKSMTRRKMFDSLAEHDMGSGSGAEANAIEIFKSAGFTLMYSGDNLIPFPGNMHTSRAVDWDSSREDNSLVRSFFPESWLFQEEQLNAQGEAVVDVKYPDSITTWIMYAVGVSRDKGICVSVVEKVNVSSDFFIDLDLPFRAVKLEEVRAKITVSNYLGYETGVLLSASADGLCVPDANGETMTYEEFRVPHGGKVTKTFSLLPVNAGSFVVRAEAVTESELDRDAIEKQLVVVCEGEPNTKSITFNLDPSGEPRNDLTVRQTVNHNIQNTRVDMAFPVEAVPESEKIQIIASGDLLGDVISNFVLGSRFPTDFDGVEGLMMELAPSCYGLQYLARLNSLSSEVLHKGRQHIRYGLAELMKYQTGDGAFSLEEYDPEYDMEPSTWFTAFVLKTLCTAKSVLDIDESVIQEGYKWMFNQITGSRASGFEVEEIDAREIEEEEEQVMAELLVSSYSCPHHMSHETARYRQTIKLWYKVSQRRKLSRHRSRLTLAKVTHALLTLDENFYLWRTAARKLKSKARRSREGYIYWTDEHQQEEAAPMLYKTKPTSETIETTAYALMVFVKVSRKYSCHLRRRMRSRTCRRAFVDPEKIADWLVLWRNGKGLFVGATDTAVATEALAKYRESKHIRVTNLNVGVSTSPNETFTHTMVFGEEDAFQPQSLSEVPLGQKLHVTTAGSGLGQMHVDASYNTPVDVNADCRFDVSVQRYDQNYESINEGRTDLCSVCGTRLTCPQGDKFECKRDSISSGAPATRRYCLNVCLKHNSFYDHGKLFIRVRMLSGYVPNECDLQELTGGRVVKASYNDEENYVHIHLKQVSASEEECVGFRIYKIRQVFRIKPAIVTIRSFNVEEWTCPRQYAGGDEEVSRPFYCSTQIHNQNRGCSCINDACVQCSPGTNLGMSDYRRKARDNSYVFKLRAVRTEEQEGTGARHLVFHVEEVLKSCLGSFNFEDKPMIFVTKRECGCPIFQAGLLYWVMGNDYNTYTDAEGQAEYRFFLNCDSFLLSSRRSADFERESNNMRRAVNSGERDRCPT